MGVIPYPMSRYYPLRKLLWSRGSLLGFNIVFRPRHCRERGQNKRCDSTRPQHARQSSCLPLARLLAGRRTGWTCYCVPPLDASHQQRLAWGAQSFVVILPFRTLT